MIRAAEELYQEVLLDHNRSPRNFRKLPVFNHQAEGYNPLCGDNIRLYLQVEDGVIKDFGFEGTGCAISRASASIMGEAVKGKRVEEAQKTFEKFHQVMTTEPSKEVVDEGLGDLGALSGVRLFPVRVKCATLCWHALQAALQEKGVAAAVE